MSKIAPIATISRGAFAHADLPPEGWVVSLRSRSWLARPRRLPWEKAAFLGKRSNPELALASRSGLLDVDLSDLELAEAAEAAAGNQFRAGGASRVACWRVRRR